MRVFLTGAGREIPVRNQERSDEDTSFHGGEIKGYENSTSAGIVPADSLRKDAVKEEWLTFIAHGIVHDHPPPETPGAGSTRKCNDANGEVNDVTFSRDQVQVSSFSDNKTTVETRADTSRRWHDPMENEVLIVGIFVSTGVLSYVVIPGLLIIWDRVRDHIGTAGENGVQQGKVQQE